MKSVPFTQGREGLYNADQISNPEKVEQLCAKNIPRMAISGRPVLNEYLPHFTARTDVEENAWVRQGVIEELGLHVSPGAQSINVGVPGPESSTVNVALYNIGDIVEKEALMRAARMPLILAPFAEEMTLNRRLFPLLRATIEMGYSSGVWVPVDYLPQVGVDLASDQEPLGVQIKSPLKYSNEPEVQMYHAEQCENPTKVLEHAELMQTVPLCASTGQRYPQDVESILLEASSSTQNLSQFWLDERQACAIYVGIAADRGVPVKLRGKDTILYNTSQTDNTMKAYLAGKNYRKMYLKSSREEIFHQPGDRW